MKLTTGNMRRGVIFSLLLLLAGCVAPAIERQAPAPTPARQVTAAPPPALTPTPTPMATLAPTPTLPPQPPMVMMGWDTELGAVIRSVDPATGLDAPGRAPIPLSRDRRLATIAPHALSADGRRIAAFDSQGDTCYDYAGGSACGPRSETLFLVDTMTWQSRTIALEAFGWVGYPVFDRIGDRLAFTVQTAGGQSLILLDAATGRTISRAVLDLKPSYLGFGPEGSLFIYGQPESDRPGLSRPGAPRVQLRGGEALAVLWETTLDGVTSGHWCSGNCDGEHSQQVTEMWWPGVALSADGGALFIVHADEDRLTTVDFAARTTTAQAIARPQARLGRLLSWLLEATAGVAHAKGPMHGTTRIARLSADGARLYLLGDRLEVNWDAAGHYSVIQSLLPLQAVDVATGAITGTSDVRGHYLDFLPDGNRLLVREWVGRSAVTHVLDAQTLAVIDRLKGPSLQSALDAAGRMRLVGQEYTNGSTVMSLHDTDTLARLAEWRTRGYAVWPAPP